MRSSETRNYFKCDSCDKVEVVKQLPDRYSETVPGWATIVLYVANEKGAGNIGFEACCPMCAELICEKHMGLKE